MAYDIILIWIFRLYGLYMFACTIAISMLHTHMCICIKIYIYMYTGTVYVLYITVPKTNIAPENRWLED